MRQAKHMISKYNGTCADCGRHIDAGEPIYWKARGVVQCSNCMPSNDNAPVDDTLPNSNAGAWSNALAWNSAPPPGASINASPAPVATSAQDYAQASQPANVSHPNPNHLNNKLADINARLQADNAPQPDPAPKFTVVDSSPAPNTSRETPPAPAYAPGDDLVTDILEDQLISLVNAITKLSPDQARFMRDYCEQLTDTRDFTRKHCFTKLAELFGA